MLPDYERICDVPTDPCCTTLWDIADHLLAIALNAVQACTSEGCDPIQGYVDHGTFAENPYADYVVVSLASIGFARSRVAERALQAPRLPILVGLYQIRLVEEGWPTVVEGDTEIYVPTPAQYHALSMHSYAHGERMFRALANAHVRKQLSPDGRCAYQELSSMTPIEPSGGQVGWQCTATIGVDFGPAAPAGS